MRTATLVGLASIPVGFLWIYLFGTGSVAVAVLAGVLVGFVYSDRPTPSQRAGARAGLFAPIPEVIVQTAQFLNEVWSWPASLEAKVFFTVLIGLLIVLLLWVVLAFVCLASAFVTDAVVFALRGESESLDQSR